MFETPYQTTPCSRYDLSNTLSSVREMEIRNELVPVPGYPNIKMVPPGLYKFQPFQQPITKIELPSMEADIIIDGRQLLRQSGQPVRTDVFDHVVLTALLTKFWYQGSAADKKELINTGPFLPRAFIQWVTKTVTQKLQFDFVQASMLRALTAIYYVQLHGPLMDPNNAAEVDKILTRAARYLPAQTSITLGRAVGDLVPLHNISDYVAWVLKVIDSPRADQLTVSWLQVALAYSWGAAYRETVAVALEYPPVFAAMVYTTAKAHSYTKTSLGMVLQDVVDRTSDKEYITSIKTLLKMR